MKMKSDMSALFFATKIKLEEVRGMSTIFTRSPVWARGFGDETLASRRKALAERGLRI